MDTDISYINVLSSRENLQTALIISKYGELVGGHVPEQGIRKLAEACPIKFGERLRDVVLPADYKLTYVYEGLNLIYVDKFCQVTVQLRNTHNIEYDIRKIKILLGYMYISNAASYPNLKPDSVYCDMMADDLMKAQAIAYARHV